MYKLMITTIIR